MESLFASLSILKLLQVVAVSGIKFLFAPILAIGYGFNYIETVAVTAAGGILGVYFFYYFSKWLISQYFRFCPVLLNYFGGKAAIEKWQNEKRCEKKSKKKFTKKNKLIIQIRKNYGLIGIVLLTPVLLSIPIGAFLARKYYAKKTNILLYMSLSVVAWSLFLSGFFFLK